MTPRKCRIIRRAAPVVFAAGVVLIPIIAAAQGRGLDNPVTACSDIAGCILIVVKYVLRLAGVLALGGIVYGGFLYIFSAGDEKGISKAKSAVTYSVIGLVVIGLSYAILSFVFGALGGGGGGARPDGGGARPGDGGARP